MSDHQNEISTVSKQIKYKLDLNRQKDSSIKANSEIFNDDNESSVIPVPKIKQNKKSIQERLEKDSMAGLKTKSQRQKAEDMQPRVTNVYKEKCIGQFKVILDGKAVVPPQIHFTLSTIAFTLILVCFQLFFNTQNFIDNQNANNKLEDEEELDYNTIIAFINTLFVLLAFISISLLVKTATTEPGIIPREQDALAGIPLIYTQMIAKQEQKTKHIINKKKLFQKLRQNEFKFGSTKGSKINGLDFQQEGGTKTNQSDPEVDTEGSPNNIPHVDKEIQIDKTIDNPVSENQVSLNTNNNLKSNKVNSYIYNPNETKKSSKEWDSMNRNQNYKDEKSKQSSSSKTKNEIICKKCPTCNIVKTPRVFHCGICDVCISVHDHHCPWLGTCIGQRNHKYFVLYLVSTTMLAASFFGQNLFYLLNNKGMIWRLEDELFQKLIFGQMSMCVFGGCITCMISVLLIYHIGIIVTNGTTQEDVRSKYELWGSNPYNYGTCTSQNCWYFWIKQDSLLYDTNEKADNLNNQHIQDKQLIESIEVSDDELSQSKISYSHVGENIDNKSMRSVQSFKSKKSIKSEFIQKREGNIQKFYLKPELIDQANAPDGKNKSSRSQRQNRSQLHINHHLTVQNEQYDSSDLSQDQNKMDIISQASNKSYKSYSAVKHQIQGTSLYANNDDGVDAVTSEYEIRHGDHSKKPERYRNNNKFGKKNNGSKSVHLSQSGLVQIQLTQSAVQPRQDEDDLYSEQRTCQQS